MLHVVGQSFGLDHWQLLVRLLSRRHRQRTEYTGFLTELSVSQLLSGHCVINPCLSMLTCVQGDTLSISEILQFSFNLHAEVFNYHCYHSSELGEGARLVLQRCRNQFEVRGQFVEPDVRICFCASYFGI